MNNCFKEDVGIFSGTHVRKVDPIVLEELEKKKLSNPLRKLPP